jgi:hypothetical protein
MFMGACRLDDPAHRTIILADQNTVNEILCLSRSGIL